jgi:hypothetical protein
MFSFFPGSQPSSCLVSWSRCAERVSGNFLGLVIGVHFLDSEAPGLAVAVHHKTNGEVAVFLGPGFFLFEIFLEIPFNGRLFALVPTGDGIILWDIGFAAGPKRSVVEQGVGFDVADIVWVIGATGDIGVFRRSARGKKQQEQQDS